MRARRFYAIRTPGVRLTYTVDGRPMGSRITPTEGDELNVQATRPTRPPSSSWSPATARWSRAGPARCSAKPAGLTVGALVLRARHARRGADRLLEPGLGDCAAAGAADRGEWLAGDLHVHTCYSHDSYCPPDDDNTGPDEFYTLGLSSAHASWRRPRGLDYLAITDHNDVRSSADPDFGAYGVIGSPAMRTRSTVTPRCSRATRSTTTATAPRRR